MEGPGTRIVLFDPRVDDLDAWPQGFSGLEGRVQVCRDAQQALRLLLASDDRAVLVARIASAPPLEALLLMHVARFREPPASIIVLTGDPEAARALLSAQGVMAEVLRAPATIDDLLVRLGP